MKAYIEKNKQVEYWRKHTIVYSFQKIKNGDTIIGIRNGVIS